ncbi:MAG: sugar ABC transporter substrate-binding protein, partial [Lachnospiraceae bacterium]|nr:sugar ABC transporter substrate-binding protein [Lachnospiraceae bacterium]
VSATAQEHAVAATVGVIFAYLRVVASAVQAYCNSVNREDIVCIGVDGNKGPLTMVKEGTLGATVFQDGVAQCDYAINTIARAIITGETEGVEMYKTDIPFVLVTSENVDQYLTD